MGKIDIMYDSSIHRLPLPTTLTFPSGSIRTLTAQSGMTRMVKESP
jgi:hypothetical protein